MGSREPYPPPHTALGLGSNSAFLFQPTQCVASCMQRTHVLEQCQVEVGRHLEIR